MSPGFFSYLGAALGFALLAVLLLPSWRNSLQGRLLTVAAGTSAAWAGLAAALAAESSGLVQAYLLLEVLRTLAWYVLLLKLLEPAARRNPTYRRFVGRVLPLATGFGGLLLAGEWLSGVQVLPGSEAAPLWLAGHVLLAIIGLSIVEQLYRNTSAGHRWAIKYLYIGAGGIFAYDLFLYADALLFHEVDSTLWTARGIVNLAAVPLLAVAAARNRDWSLNIFVSRDIILNSTAVLAGGLYLLVMAGAGYVLREVGGDWGLLVQAVFFSLAIGLLAAVLFSAQVRAQARVFLGKHFYRNKYDYRREWLRLTGELGADSGDAESLETAIRVLAAIVDARAGLLWLRDERGGFANVAAWNTDRVNEPEAGDSGLVGFLSGKTYVINLGEVHTVPAEYEGLDLPGWLAAMPGGWLVVPLPGLDSLAGFVVLARPLVERSINWEDRDLLVTAARQVASHIAVLRTTDALAQARQFEMFNRLSAFMVHDLKNVAAELELVAKNAARHRHNPAFIDDSLDTVATASRDIRRLLRALRDRSVVPGKPVMVDLCALVNEVSAAAQGAGPQPTVREHAMDCRVIADRDRLGNVLKHLLDNARQATPADGSIELCVHREGAAAVVEIRDSGHGMSAEFIHDRLFRPFDTTRGNAGMGIGMYESREYIREIGGDMHVESRPGEGTCIRLQIPLADAEQAQLGRQSTGG